jgi:hypothetical protein
MSVYSVDKLIAQARLLATEYRRATGRPLPGVSGEISQYDAARLLDLELRPGENAGYDAIGRGRRAGRRIQIKARAIFDQSKSGQRIGQIKIDQDWDIVILVLMDENFEPFEIYEAEREGLVEALAQDTGSKRSKRGAMSVARFKAIGRLVWTRENGIEDDDGIWDNRAGG